MATQFTGPYQSIYEAGLARQREEEARLRAAAGRRASLAGVSQSGVSQIPQDEISRESLRDVAELGGRVAQAQEEERLQDKAFDQRKELMSLRASIDELAAARERKRRRDEEKAGYGSQLIAGALGGLGNYLRPKG